MTKIIYICDECGNELECEPGDGFKEAWAAAKEEGWRCFKIKDENKQEVWKHACPDCKSAGH